LITENNTDIDSLSNGIDENDAIQGLGIYITPEFHIHNKRIPVHCLIDTGSQINIILSERFLPPGEYDYMPILFERINSLTGHAIAIKGDLFITIRNKNILTNERVTIIDKSVPLNGGVIGMPYLIKSGAKFNFDAEEMIINDEILAPIFTNAELFRDIMADQIKTQRNIQPMLEHQRKRQQINHIAEWLHKSTSTDAILEQPKDFSDSIIKLSHEPETWNLEDLFKIKPDDLFPRETIIAMLKVENKVNPISNYQTLPAQRNSTNVDIKSKVSIEDKYQMKITKFIAHYNEGKHIKEHFEVQSRAPSTVTSFSASNCVHITKCKICEDELNNWDFDNDAATVKTQTSVVYAPRRFTIEPFKARKIFGKIEGNFHTHTNDSIYIQGKELAPEVKTMEGISGARSNGLVPMILENQSPNAITLEAGTVLSKVQSVIITNDLQDILLDPPVLSEVHNTPDLSPTERGDLLISQVDLTHLDTEQRQRAEQLLRENHDCFMLTENDNITIKGVEASLEVTDGEPIFVKQYRLPAEDQKEMDEQIDMMIKRNIIEPALTNRYNSPQFILSSGMRPDGTRKKKIVTDLRKINSKLMINNFIYPCITECIENIGPMKMFSTLDLNFAYGRLAISPESRELLAFTHKFKRYRFQVLPYGLSIGPDILNSFVNKIFEQLIERKILNVFFDDLCVGAMTFEESVSYLTEIFLIARAVRLKFSADKSKLFRSSVIYLGFEISQDGITADVKKIDKLINLKTPTCQKDLRKFLGFINFYHQLIFNYAYHADSLHKLLQKDRGPFIWTQEAEDSFQFLKYSLCTPPVLAFPDPQMNKYLFIDSSLSHVGAILTQKYGDIYRPIGFASKRLNLSQRKLTIYSLELFACYFGVKHFAKYLCQRTVYLKSDCKSLQFLMTQSKLPPNQARQVLFLSTYKIIIDHIAGISNPSDFMSRIIAKLSIEQPYSRDDDCVPMFSKDLIKAFQDKDNEIQLIKENLYKNEKLSQAFCISEGVLFKQRDIIKAGSTDKIYVPLSLRTEIIRAYHNNPLVGHMGILRTKLLIDEKYYWKNIRRDVTQHIRACKLCNYRKRGNYKRHFKIAAMDRCQGPNETCSVDVCGPLTTTSNGNKYFINILDHFTRGTQSYAIKDQSAKSIAGAIYKYILQFGCMQQLISDNFSTMHSATYQELCKLFNVSYLYGTFYAKKSTGSVERSIRKTWDILAILQKTSSEEWDNLMDPINCIQRATPNLSTGQTPFTLETGRLFKMPFQPLINNTSSIFYNDEDYLLKTRDNLKQIYDAAAKINEREAAKFVSFRNKKAASTEFKPGDLVFIFFPQLIRPTGLKDSLPFCGPYQIQTVKRDKTVYAISLATQKVIKVHAERCRLYVGNQIHERRSEHYFSEAAPSPAPIPSTSQSSCILTGPMRHDDILIQSNSSSGEEISWVNNKNKNALESLASTKRKPAEAEKYLRGTSSIEDLNLLPAELQSKEDNISHGDVLKATPFDTASGGDTDCSSDNAQTEAPDSLSDNLCAEQSELDAIAPESFSALGDRTRPAVSGDARKYNLRDRRALRKPSRFSHADL
jgi:hypothetical protein